MALEVVTGNHAAGYALSVGGEANRRARGVCCGIYPITPQTEIVEFVARFKFSKGRVVHVESEHSAMGVCIGAGMNGARSFTASAANGLTYMAENIFTAGYYRVPVVLVGVNRTMGPPWNIWADQSDTLMLRDGNCIQFYCEDNQEVVDSILLAFRLGEDRRILLPVMVIMEAFIMSHTQMNTELPEQGLVDRYLPPFDLPHRLDNARPSTVGGLAWPQETLSMRVEVDEVFRQIPAVYDECRQAFLDVFGRDVGGFTTPYETEDAELVLVASGTIATTTREVVKKRRAAGEKIGMVKVKAFRPFPEKELLGAVKNARKVGVLDRNYAAGIGGIFWQDLRAAAQGKRDDLVLQDYLVGVCGGDVTPDLIEECIEDLRGRRKAGSPVWKGIEA
ncbi:MAG: pyruvate ferredoxin oxidoreductase [Planctomycetes bacterium]|nr:pyruvate ferredoxin oxidoreductase [Planctomycetota bacterium]